MIGFNVCYAEGAPGFCTNNAVFTLYNSNNSVGVGWIADGVFANGTQIELTRVWSALAAYEHIWNPKWRTSVFGGYVNVDYNGNATALIQQRLPGVAAGCGVAAIAPALSTIQPLPGNSCSPDYGFWEAGTRTQWNPVPQLDIGLEVLYSKRNTAFKGPAIVRVERLAARRGQRSSTTRTSGPRCSAGSATSIHDRLSDPGKLPTPGGKPPGVFAFGKHGP